MHLLWLEGAGDSLDAGARSGCAMRKRPAGNTALWLRLLVVLVLAHAGLVILLVLAAGWPRVRASPAPPLARPPVDAVCGDAL